MLHSLACTCFVGRARALALVVLLSQRAGICCACTNVLSVARALSRCGTHSLSNSAALSRCVVVHLFVAARSRRVALFVLWADFGFSFKTKRERCAHFAHCSPARSFATPSSLRRRGCVAVTSLFAQFVRTSAAAADAAVVVFIFFVAAAAAFFAGYAFILCVCVRVFLFFLFLFSFC